MAQTIIANLPTTSEINPQSYVIIERPGIGKGTYKSTVKDLQDAITVHATVEQEDDVTTITVSDINGTTQETIVTPTAKISDNGDNTATITITDTHGVTSETIVSRVELDVEPTPDSPNLLTSGSIYTMQSALEDRIGLAEDRLGVVEERADADDVRMDSMDARMDRIDQRIDALEQRIFNVESVADHAIVVEDGNRLPKPFKVAGEVFADLKDAMLAAAANGRPLVLIDDADNSGVSIPSGTNVTVDLNGYTLNMTGPGAGSHGTETNGMQLLKDSNITFKNGKIRFNDSRLKMGIQNYSNLTLDNIDISGGPTIQYVVSNNFGNIVFTNKTKITPSANQVAFDVWYGLSPAYYDGVNVRITDTSVQINGKIEFGKQRGASGEMFAEHASLTCPTDMVDVDRNLSLLTRPCHWSANLDGSRTLRYWIEEQEG